MSVDRDELSVRKDLVLAQSALHRAQLEYQVVALRARVSRGTSMVARGATLLAFLRTALSVATLFRK
jgi:16S rRNA G1207 methylase RsmC